MIYGWRNDTNSINSIVSDSLNNSASFQYDMTCLSDLFTSSESSSSELNVTEIVQNILDDNYTQGDVAVISEPPSSHLMRFFINRLYEQIASLNDQIVYLKAESLSKNSTIGNLFSEIADLQRNYNHRVYSENSVSSIWLDKFMGTPNCHSSFQGDNIDHTCTEVNDASPLTCEEFYNEFIKLPENIGMDIDDYYSTNS